MATSLLDRIQSARHSQFVGREAERALFRSALEAPELPFHVLDVHGPGGVGKTTLLREFEHLCRQSGTPVYYLDARDVDPTPEAFAHALRRRRDLEARADGLGTPHADGTRFVLLVDTFERLRPLERWLREQFLPHLPGRILLVLSGRQPLPSAWRTDLGLHELVRALPLRNLPAEQSRRYLEQRGVPEAQQDEVLHFTYGHPLALSLVADAFEQQPDRTFEPDGSPDLIGTLVKRFIRETPSPAHRAALEASALTRCTTEALLAHLLDGDDVRPLFDWLHSLSFIERGEEGLLPHELARDVIAADLRWRDPEQHEALQQRARRYYSAQLNGQAAHQHEHERILTNYLFLYRDNPVVRPYFRRLREKWKGREHLAREPAREADWPALRAMTARHEGEASAKLLMYWKERRPEGAEVFRDPDGEPVGFSLHLDLHEMTEEDRRRDPCTRAACRYLEEHAPLREGEEGALFRFWMERDEYQRVSPAQSLISTQRVRDYLTTPRLAFSFIPCGEPDYWALLFAYADMHHLPEAGFEVGGQRFGMFGHDWRVRPPAAWLDLLAERDVAPREPEAVSSSEALPVIVLSEADFAGAVKQALEGYARPEALHDNPLLRSRLVLEAAGREAGS